MYSGGPGSSPEDGGLTTAILSAPPQSPDVHLLCGLSILGLVSVFPFLCEHIQRGILVAPAQLGAVMSGCPSDLSLC